MIEKFIEYNRKFVDDIFKSNFFIILSIFCGLLLAFVSVIRIFYKF